jgi:FG-GAP repeat
MRHQSQGEAYVFVKPRSGWTGTHTETARLIPSGGRSHGSLGTSVAVSAGTVVAGAPDRTVGSHPYQGALYVYTKPASAWSRTRTETGMLTASDGFGKVENGDVFGDELGGFSLAISGDTIVSSSASHTVGKALFQGEAYVFVRPKAGWGGSHTETAKLTASNGHASDWFGEAVAVDGRTSVISAPDHVPVNPLTPGRGAAYVFVREPDTPPVGPG